MVIQNGTNKVHNIERAVARHCPHKGYAVLLNKGENFNSILALKKIAKELKTYNRVGLFVSLMKDGEVFTASRHRLHFDRRFEGIQNPNIQSMNEILNHFRVFSV